MAPRPRRRIVTRGRVIAWIVALVLGVVWAALLHGLHGDWTAFATLLLGVGGIFGTVFGVLAATGMLVRVLSLLGNPTRGVDATVGELSPDLAFGVFLVLFFLPSLVVYWGG